MDRSIVHQRWVEACIKDKQIYDHINAYHLAPLPQRVPLQAFKEVSVAFCAFTSELDQLIFTSLSALYGFKEKFKE